MLDIVLQFLGLAILIGGMWWGWRRWIKAHARAAGPEQTGLMLLVLLTLLGGLIGSPFWWMDVERSFSWDLPPLAARMLGAAGFSFAAGAYMALERPTTHRLRQIVFMLFVYLTPLVLAIFLFHLDRFDFEAPITYAFFAVAGGMTVVNGFFLARRTPGVLDSPALSVAPTAAGEKIWLIIVALVTGLWGLALFITDNGVSDLIWVWRGDLLTSRLIGSMLLTIATGSLTALLHRDAARLMRLVTLIYGLGLALAAVWNAFAGLPVKWSYVVVFGVIGIGSGLIGLLPEVDPEAGEPSS
jgi:hypothetical protein